jgi:hypothetical protein
MLVMGRTVESIIFLLLVIALSFQILPLARADVNCRAVILSPSADTSYTDLMALNFTAQWTKGNWTEWILPRYFYIDNGSRVSVITEPFPYVYFEDMNTTIAINDTIDVSNLTDGMHTLTLYADGTVNEANLILNSVNFTLSTTHFRVGELPAPTPSPLFSAILVVAIIAVVAAGILVYFKKRKRAS